MNKDDRSHFIISKNDISQKEIEKSGFGEVYKRGDLANHSQILKRSFTAITTELNKTKDMDVLQHIALSVKVPIDWNAKNEKGHLENLGFEVLEYSNSDKSVITVSIPKSKWVEVGQKIETYAETKGSGKTNLQGIDGFIKRPEQDAINIKENIGQTKIEAAISFFDIFSETELSAISEKINIDLSTAGNFVNNIRLSDNDIIIECKADAKALAKIARDYISVKSIFNNEEISVERTALRSEKHAVNRIEKPITDQTIGVIDDGIFPRIDLNPIVKDRVVNQIPGAVTAVASHGTYVASRCVFGDIELSDMGKTLIPSCCIADIPVFGYDKSGNYLRPKETDLIKAIDDYVSANYKSVRIYNISLGFGNPIGLQKISETAKRLDILSKKYDVLFVVAAGNINNQLGDYPAAHFNSAMAKISSPSESILCLCVGSIAKHAKTISMSKENELSAFSRIGPGLFGSIKPDLVAHGGNLNQNYQEDPDIATSGFSQTAGILDSDNGTSFAAPIIANIAAHLYDYYPMFGTNMIRALLIHNTIKRKMPSGVGLSDYCGTGYGEPILDSCIKTKGNACVYLYEGELNTQNYEYVSFYVPTKVAKGNQEFTVKVTICIDPDVNKNNDREYSCARISSGIMHLRKEILKKATPAECNLSEPYNSIMQFSNLHKRRIEPGYWAVRIRLFARNVNQNVYKQKFAIVIEIIDNKNMLDLRKEVLEETGEKYQSKKADRKYA